jgi:ABC-2 type transport system permease protein
VKKLLVITGKEIGQRFTDPAVLLLAIAMPLLISVLLDRAFGDLVLGRGIPDRLVPVGIVNQDRGGAWGNLGDLIVRALTPTADETPLLSEPLFRLFNVQQIADEAQARRLVEREKLIAALFIPPDFSEAVATESASIEVYINGREEIRAAAFRTLAETLASMISAGEVTVRTSIKGLAGYPRIRTQLESGALDRAIQEMALAAVRPESNPIQVQRIEMDNVLAPARLGFTHYLAAALAITFAAFTALVGSASLLQEEAQGTWQRMVVTPTPTGIILAGKTLGTVLNSLLQMGVLIGGLTVLEWLRKGGPGQGPSVDVAGLSALVLAVAVASTGVGVAIASLSRTYAQAANVGRAVLVLMGLVGGIFFPAELFPRPLTLLSRATFQYWAMDGYERLSAGATASGILPHILILFGMGLLCFALGGWVLKRRLGFA